MQIIAHSHKSGDIENKYLPNMEAGAADRSGFG